MRRYYIAVRIGRLQFYLFNGMRKKVKHIYAATATVSITLLFIDTITVYRFIDATRHRNAFNITLKFRCYTI